MMRWFVQHGMTPQVLDHLEFPTHKPGAVIYIDDRGYHFRGIFPHVSYIQEWRPWNK
jgi:predicted phosphatase